MQGMAALVTGGSRGIGKATVLALEKRGCSVTFVYHSNAQAAYELCGQITDSGGKVQALQADISKEEEIQRIVQTAKEKWGKLDYVIHCAGVMKDRAFVDLSSDEWDEILDTNLKSAYLITRYSIPYLMESKCGRIILLSSQAAETGSCNHAHYAAAKAGIRGLAYTLAKELGKYNITVNIVSPGRIRTDMIEERKKGRIEEWMRITPLGRLGEPEEVAEPIAFLCSEGAGYITGANINISGGLLMG